MPRKGEYTDYSGKQFGRLKAIKRIGSNKRNQSIWLFQCDCGNTWEGSASAVTTGNTRSCGCLVHDWKDAEVNKYAITQPSAGMKVDLTGQKFNRLTAVKYIGKVGSKNSVWLWRCDCGSEVELSSDKVQSNHTKSCGCLNSELSSVRYKTLTAKLPGEAARNATFNSYKQGARIRDINFELTYFDCMELFSQDCYYCNRPPSNIKTVKSYNGSFTYNGIDRKDNDPKKGYRLDNVVPCCARCNRAKGTMDFDEYLDFLVISINHVKSKHPQIILKLVA